MSSQNSHPKSQYHEALMGIMKITYRDGDISEKEKQFMKRLSTKLGISNSEYEVIVKTYMSHQIKAPNLHSQRVDNFYNVVKVIHSDKEIGDKEQTLWLTRMATAMGFDPSNVKYIVGKSLDLFDKGCDLETYKLGMKTMME